MEEAQMLREMEGVQRRREVEEAHMRLGSDDVNLFVKYLPQEMNDTGLRQLFSNFGEIVSAKVMMDSSSGSSLGFGYD
jgi:RNA recognition motif-containing protein